MADKLDDFRKLNAALETMKCAGWITSYNIVDSTPIIQWTDHGRERAAQLLAIADELDAGAYDWLWFETAARFLRPDKGEHFVQN